MINSIEAGYMVYIKDGSEGIGAVRKVGAATLTLYVENSGEFEIPRTAVREVHEGKVMLNPALLPKRLLQAVGHIHDSEDPKLVG